MLDILKLLSLIFYIFIYFYLIININKHIILYIKFYI